MKHMKIENYKDNKDALRALTRQLMDYMELKKGYSITNATPAAYILSHAVDSIVYTTL